MKHRLSLICRSDSGFALAAVLWLLAGLTILAAMISQSNQVLAERQALLKRWADAEQDFLSSRSEALYWLSTSPATDQGFGWSGQYVRVDGRGYAGTAKSTIQFQDTRGLLSFNLPDRALLSRLLLGCGAEETETSSLIDALLDYAEPGKLKRLNGAKDFEYSAAGMAPPRGAPLVSEPEIWKVFGWEKLHPSWDKNKCFEDVTVWSDGNFNPGTATPRALAAFGLSSEAVAQIEKERLVNESTLINRLYADSQSKNFMGLQGAKIPATTLRVTQSSEHLQWVLRYELKLKTNVEGVPWEVISPRRLALSSVMMPTGRQDWPRIDKLSEADKNAITQPILPF